MLPEKNHGTIAETAARLSQLVSNPSDMTIRDALIVVFDERHPNVESGERQLVTGWASYCVCAKVRKLMEVES